MMRILTTGMLVVVAAAIALPAAADPIRYDCAIQRWACPLAKGCGPLDSAHTVDLTFDSSTGRYSVSSSEKTMDAAGKSSTILIEQSAVSRGEKTYPGGPMTWRFLIYRDWNDGGKRTNDFIFNVEPAPYLNETISMLTSLELREAYVGIVAQYRGGCTIANGG